ncbi:MAG: response regulator transcription factor [Nitrospira sp.]|nr:response regulator transcription factor [Nitrospira sp.]
MEHNVPKSRQARQHKRRTTSASSRSLDMVSSCRQPIRVFIANGQEIVRAGVRTFLHGEEDLIVVGEGDHVDGVLSGSWQTKPDVIVLESGLSGGSDPGIYKRLFNLLPSVRIISWLRDDNAEAFRSAVEGGAQGYVQEKSCCMELVRAIRAVGKGGGYLAPEAAEKTLCLLRQSQDLVCFRWGLSMISPQERRILALMAEGNTNKEIAVKLLLSDKTIKNYISNMFAKLEIKRRTQAVALYLKGLKQHTPMGKGTSASCSVDDD